MSEIQHKPIISEGNSTSNYLLVDGEWKGLWDDISDWRDITTTCDRIGSLYYDLSEDGGSTFVSVVNIITDISNPIKLSTDALNIRVRFIGDKDLVGNINIETKYSNNLLIEGVSTEDKQDEILNELQSGGSITLLEGIKSQVEINQNILNELKEITNQLKKINS